VCALTCGLFGASPAMAQRVAGPYAGALGGPPADNRVQGLDFGGSIFGAWDQNNLPASTDSESGDPRLRESGASAGLSGTLSYDRRGDRARFRLNGGATAQRYSTSPDLIAAYNAGTSISAGLGSRANFSASLGAAYSPFLQFSPFGGSVVGDSGGLTGGFNYAAVAERNLALDASTGLTVSFTPRTSLYLAATGRDWRILDTPADSLRTYDANAGIRHQLTRKLAVHLGYGRIENDYAFAEAAPNTSELIDAGVEYGDSLAFARRTSLTFSTSTQAIQFDGDTHYRLNGAALLTRGFKRTWSASLGYDRSTEYRIGFRAPLLSDSFSAGVSGLLSPRVQWSAMSAYSHGAVGFGGSNFNTATGSTRLDLAVSRTVALYGQYAMYYYEIPPGSSALDVLPRFSREVGTVGLTLRVPLINQMRPPSEPNKP